MTLLQGENQGESLRDFLNSYLLLTCLEDAKADYGR
jgi:hypothetical protein